MSRIRTWARRLWPAATTVGLIALGFVAVQEEWLNGDQVGVVISGAALLAAVASWAATSRASDTAERVAAIERSRWHQDSMPKLEVSMHALGIGVSKAHLHVTFNEPAVHKALKSVTLSIVDDGRDRPPHITHGLTQQQIDAQIWGPYKFEATNNGVSRDGRDVPPFPIKIGQQRSFFLSSTAPPNGYPGNWHSDWSDQPLRLWIECAVEGAEQPWTYIKDVQPPWVPDWWHNPPST